MLAPSPRQCRAPLGVLAWQRPRGRHGGLFGAPRPSRRHRSAEKEPHAEPGFQQQLLPNWAGGGALEDPLAEVSAEFRELCQGQVQLLLAALHASLLAKAAPTAAEGGGQGRGQDQDPEGLPNHPPGSHGSSSSRNTSSSTTASTTTTTTSSSSNEGGGGDGSGEGPLGSGGAALVHGTTLCCAVYCRTAPSLRSGQLRLQLVAQSGSEGAAGGGWVDQQSLFLGRGQYSLEDHEEWIVEQSIIVLPDSGGLVLPLSHNGWLLGLLVVERGSPAMDPAASPLLQPLTCTLLGPREFQLLRQGAGVLALACAMDLRAALERAGNAMRQRQVRGLVQEARKPLSTLRTLGAFLLPRLPEGEPDRDMAEGIMAQGTRLAELVAQLQAALHPTPGLPSTQSTAQLPLDLSSSSGSSGSSIPGAQPEYPGYPSSAASKQPWSGPGSAAAGGSNVQQPPVPRLLPALPSPSIGADTAVRTIDLDAGDWATGPSNGVPPGPPIAAGAAAAVARAMGAYPKGALPPAASIGLESAQQGPSSRAPSVSASAVRPPPLGGGAATPVSGSGGGANSSSKRGGGSAAGGDISRGEEPSSGLMEEPPSPGEPPPNADLINTLMPLLATAYSFCAVKGVRFLMLPGDAIDLTVSPSSGGSGGGSSGVTAPAGARTGLPCADVGVPAPALKRMLSQLVDGVIACAAQGDCVEVAVHARDWEGRPGVAVVLGCLQDMAHCATAEPGAPRALSGPQRWQPGLRVHPPPGPLARQPEFAFLSASAQQAGGWFEVQAGAGRPVVVEDAAHVQHLNCSSIAAVLWLPAA